MTKNVWLVGLVVLLLSTAGVAQAEGGSSRSHAENSNAYGWGLAFTIGEGMYFIDGDVYRGPVSLEVVPSFGWDWFKFDLGLYTTLESIKIAGTNVGNWNFTFRPGGRVTPPMLPLYGRIAFPLQLQKHNFDYGVMLGIGADFPVTGILGIVVEVDTTLSDKLRWGGDGVPLEFRVGISLRF